MNQRAASSTPPSRQWHAAAIDAVAATLESDITRGLSAAEAQRRLGVYGPNRILEAEAVSPLGILARQFTSIVVLVLIAAAVLAAVLGDLLDGAAIAAIIVLNATIGFFQEYRAETAVAELARMTAPRARVLRGGEAMTVAADEVVPGDLLLVEAGDLVAADARIVDSAGLETNEAPLTGESVPVAKTGSECDGSTPLAERRNMVFLGTAATRGSARAIVVATGMGTEFGRIAGMLETASSGQTPLQRRLDLVANRLLWFCLGIVVIVLILGAARAASAMEVFLGAVSLAVASIPEGLPAIVTVALALGVSRMARRHALVRRLKSVETLGCAQVICTDKTGTLTVGEMTVRRIVTADAIFNVTGEGYSVDGGIFSGGEIADRHPALADLLLTGAACNDARLSRDGGRPAIIGDPTEGALLVLAEKGGIRTDSIEAEMPRIGTIPFTSERRLMTVIRRTPDGLVGFVKGAPEAILERCTHLRDSRGTREMTPGDRARMVEASGVLAAEAMRVIGCARSKVRDETPDGYAGAENNLEFLGLVAMIDPPRSEARQAVDKCRIAGIRTVMITGDHPVTAAAIARELGILERGDRSLAGADLDRMSDEELAAIVGDVTVYARATAEHKLRVVRAWKARGAVVAMTGDGVNDAPALKEAAIGIAMGIAGTEVTRQAADMVIADDNFASIVSAIEEGRGVYDNIARTLQYLMAGNAGELMVMLAAAVAGWPPPLLPTQLLWINLISDGLPALALVTDPIDPEVLRRPPRRPDAEIIDRPFVAWAALTAVLSATVTLAAFAYGLHAGMDLPRARNLGFFALVSEELARSFAARSPSTGFGRMPFLSNLRLLGVVLGSLALQFLISATPLFEEIFRTRRLHAAEAACAMALATIPMLTLQALRASGFEAWLARRLSGADSRITER
jgi:Ca2+-transporting ATPase